MCRLCETIYLYYKTFRQIVIYKSVSLRAAITGLICALVSLSAHAQSNNSTVFRFLEVTPAAKASALGGNHTGLYDADYSLFQLNPAYLQGSETRMISASFVNHLLDARMGMVHSALTINEFHTLGFGLRFQGYGDFNSLDEDGNETGSFDAVDIAFGTAYSTIIAPKIYGGISLDLIHSSYESYNSSGLAVSGGLLYRNPDKELSIGLAVRNLGTQLSTFNGIREPLPLDVSVGITKKPEGFPARISLTLRRLNDWDMRSVGEQQKPEFLDNMLRHLLIGGEFGLSPNFRVRLGYNHFLHEQTKTKENFDLAGLAFGIGLSVKDFIIDISRHSYSELGGVVQLSIRTTL